MGLARIVQSSDSVVAKRREAERRALHTLDEIVGGLGRFIRHLCPVPRADLVEPSQQRPAERAHLEGARLILEVVAEPFGELEGRLSC